MGLVKIEKHNSKKAIEESLKLIDYQIPPCVHRIAIKPNMCYYWDYTTGQTTDPRFVAALVDVIRDEVPPDAQISIVESDASAMRCKYAFRMLGYEKMAQHHKVALVNLSEDKGEKIEVSAGGQSFSFLISETIQNADFLINVPKIKYLTHTKVSCALKNTYGCNPYPKKFRYHSRLDEAIVALNKIIKFDLNILDGIIVSGSQPRRLDLVMSSEDPVALDAAATRIAGLNPKSVGHIRLAHEERVGNLSFISKGIPVQYFSKSYPKMSAAYRTMSLGYRLLLALGLGKRLALYG